MTNKKISVSRWTITKAQAKGPLNTDEVIDLSLDKLSKDTFINMLG